MPCRARDLQLLTLQSPGVWSPSRTSRRSPSPWRWFLQPNMRELRGSWSLQGSMEQELCVSDSSCTLVGAEEEVFIVVIKCQGFLDFQSSVSKRICTVSFTECHLIRAVTGFELFLAHLWSDLVQTWNNCEGDKINPADIWSLFGSGFS